MTLSGRDSDEGCHNPGVTREERRAEARRKIELLLSDDSEEREEAKDWLRQLAEDWRGFPGKRRRGELPRGVTVR